MYLEMEIVLECIDFVIPLNFKRKNTKTFTGYLAYLSKSYLTFWEFRSREGIVDSKWPLVIPTNIL